MKVGIQSSSVTVSGAIIGMPMVYVDTIAAGSCQIVVGNCGGSEATGADLTAPVLVIWFEVVN